MITPAHLQPGIELLIKPIFVALNLLPNITAAYSPLKDIPVTKRFPKAGGSRVSVLVMVCQESL